MLLPVCQAYPRDDRLRAFWQVLGLFEGDFADRLEACLAGSTFDRLDGQVLALLDHGVALCREGFYLLRLFLDRLF